MANPIVLLLRHAVEARLEALFARGDRVLDLGCGTGEMALALASRGIRVASVDAESLLSAGGGFDGAYAELGAVSGASLLAVGTALAAALRPGAAIVLRLPGPFPLPAVIRRTLTGLGEPRPSSPTLAEARAALGSGFHWTDAYALGVLVPGPEQERWAAEHPQSLGVLAALERGVRRWPGLRQLGELSVLEGRRRPHPMTDHAEPLSL
jgi:SAM-dependent methyltransferase